MAANVQSLRDQRRFRRYFANFPCSVRPAKRARRKASSETLEVLTTTQDVSRSGLYFTVPGEWTVGTKIECVLHLSAKVVGPKPVAIRCRGKIARIVTQEEGRVGVGATIESFEFIHIDRETSNSSISKE